MVCKSCGAQIADQSIFCTNCGVRIQPVNETVAPGGVTVPMEAAEQPKPVQENTAAESAVPAEKTEQPEPVQENTAAESAVPAEKTEQPEPAQEDMAAGNRPQTDEAVNEQRADGQTEMGTGGTPNGQAPSGQPQMQTRGTPNGQAPYGQPQMQTGGTPNGQAPYGQPQMQTGGTPNGQAPYGQPQMQMNGMPQAGSVPNGMPFGQAVKPPKKPFVMPAAVNVAGGILAVAAVAVFVFVLLFGKPEEKESDRAVSVMAIPEQRQMVDGGDEINVDLSGVAYQLEIPETDGYRAAQELAEGYFFEDSDTRQLEEADLYAYTKDELWYAYYEILAREGIDLSEVDDEMQEYFQRKNWYEPTVSLVDVLTGLDEEQIAYYNEMLENDEDPSYAILLEAGILNETEVYNMKLIEEYVTYGTTSAEGPEDALDDMLEDE